MHSLTRKLASDPAEWLWMHTQSRTPCPARCDEGTVYYQTERASWEYPGAWEGHPCERCGGLGYLLRVWRRSKLTRPSLGCLRCFPSDDCPDDCRAISKGDEEGRG